ncbi:MAG: phytoene desaturase family protein [Dongiaceae bacterium]
MLWDAIVVGAGHNGLTAAAYLGKAGLRTLVLERAPVVGGAAISEEFHPGYRNSVASYTVSLLRPEVIADLDLPRHGYRTIPYSGALRLFADGRTLFTDGDPAHDRAAIGRFSNRDYDNLERFYAMIQRVGAVVRAQWLAEPPDLGGGFLELLSLLKAGREARALTPELRHFLLQLFTTSANAIVDRWLDSEAIRNEVAAHCVSGNFASLDQPGSAIPFFHHALGEFEGRRGSWGLVRGGMGRISDAMAAAACEAGVEIRTGAPIARILIEGGRAAGVRLESGEEIRAHTVLSNADPKRTFLGLVGEEHLDPSFAADIRHIRMGHASLRMNLALSAAPEFAHVDTADAAAALGASVVMFPDRATLEANYRTALAGGIPAEPYVNLVIPSALDDSLAPPGHHVMSLLCKYFPYRLAGGESWDRIGGRVADGILAKLERHIPNLRRITVARQLLTPLDIERRFGLTEGDIFHGRHDLDQILSLRPHPAAARYRTPVPGLYLCGSGSHPGGGVSGAPGRNAARRVMRDFGRRPRSRAARGRA